MADETSSSQKEFIREQNATPQPDGSCMIVRSLEFGVRSYGAKCISFFIFLFFSQGIFAQHTILINEDVSPLLDYYYNNSNTHSAIKPALDVDLYRKTYKILDSSVYISSDNYKSKHDFYSEHVLHYPRASFKKYYLSRHHNQYNWDGNATAEKKAAFLLRPVYDLNFGFDISGNRALYSTVGGAIMDFDYKQKIGLEVRFAGGTTTLPNYSDSIAMKTGIMPGWGDRAYPNNNANYSFQHISGNLIWRPLKIFNLQVGRDKHFWGDGYRSLFLSDLSAAMPYIKQSTTIWKLQYTSLFTWMQDYTHSTGAAADFRNKFATFHYISFNANKWLNVGIFESVIWQGNDPSRQRGFDPNYLNPVIFFRPVEYSLGSSDNAMLGASVKIRLNRNNQFYAQIILDEFFLKEILAGNGWWANKQGYQLGYKCFNFGKVKNLFMQTELNIVRPYTYSHGSSQQSYSNAGMPLAHPLGANFVEWLALFSYTQKDFTFTGKIIGAQYGLDPAGKNFGQNIFLSYMNRSATDPLFPTERDYNHKLYDGILTTLFYSELKVSYKFKMAFPLNLELLLAGRREHNEFFTKNSSYIQLGLRLPLWRMYRDY